MTADESGLQKSEAEEIPEGVLDLRVDTLKKRKKVATEERNDGAAAGSSEDPAMAAPKEDVETTVDTARVAEDAAINAEKEKVSEKETGEVAKEPEEGPRPQVAFRMSRIPMAKVQAVWPKVFGRSVFETA